MNDTQHRDARITNNCRSPRSRPRRHPEERSDEESQPVKSGRAVASSADWSVRRSLPGEILRSAQHDGRKSSSAVTCCPRITN